ncbi:MAG: HAMP domain-containing protein, partial [Nocardioidaceae bacterium]
MPRTGAKGTTSGTATGKPRSGGRRQPAARSDAQSPEAAALATLTEALTAVRDGDLRTRLQVRSGPLGEVAAVFNEVVARQRHLAGELDRVQRVVGRDGRLTERLRHGAGHEGSWATSVDAANSLLDSLAWPTVEVGRVISAVAQGDLSQSLDLEVDGRPMRGEFLRTGRTVNKMVDQLSLLTSEVTRVASEVGTEGNLGNQARVRGALGSWKNLTDSVNLMANRLTAQVRDIAVVTTAVAQGDLSRKVTVEAEGEMLQLKVTVNEMVDTLRAFADEVTRVALEVGTEGVLGGQADVQGVAGTWKDLTDSVNVMASNLTNQVRDISRVAQAVAGGDLSQQITVNARGEIAELADSLNSMTGTLRTFADEVTRVAREVGSEGRLGGQAAVPGVAGTWRDLTDSVNVMAGNLTNQVRNIAQVTTAVAKGDLSQKVTVDVKGELLELKSTVNTMVDQLSSFADEVTRVAREVGTEGRLGGQAHVRGVSGTWKDLTENVNFMANNLTGQVRSIAQVSSAVARGDLSQKITVEAKGEIAALAETLNGMVDTLRTFADEVTRVSREVGTDGRLGGQASVPGVSGTWKNLTDNVNSMASNLTEQVRAIANVTTAVANGDLSQKIYVDARGEILELKTTINSMVEQLSAFASEVTRVAREVGIEGRLGGQAEVFGVSGTWARLTESVNELAGNLTTQVRAIADVATAVTRGDLTQEITVDASGEVAGLKDRVNQMIDNLRDTTLANQEQDWLKSNLARLSGMMQGRRDLQGVARLIMSELTPLISAQHGAFFLATNDESGETELRLIASYGYETRKSASNRFGLGESLVGQAALEKKPIVVMDPPSDYVQITSGLGAATPASIVVMPVLFEDQVLGVIELASFTRVTEVHRNLLDQLMESVGVLVNTIIANSRTEELLGESQRLANELQTQQGELQQRNVELQEKAGLLAEQNRSIEIKNVEIEQARSTLQERAEQLALSSQYKTEFLANMSHELRTPLNSMMILAKLLCENPDGALSQQQVDFAETIHSAGADLLQLINDILDLSKVEAGKMELRTVDVTMARLVDYVEATFRPLAADKGLSFRIAVDPDVPEVLHTDEQRLQQILRNLLSNAIKFTDSGEVQLHLAIARGIAYESDRLRNTGAVLAASVTDTGIGIAESRLPVIFEPFEQVEGTADRRFGGTGLGLSISREIAGMLGGEIRVESVVGVGSTFTLYLPVHLQGRDERLGEDGDQSSATPDTEQESTAAADAPDVAGESAPMGAEDSQEPAGTTSRPGRVVAESAQDRVVTASLVVPTQSPRSADAGLMLSGRKVLIIDDDIRSVFALVSALELRHLNVVYAESGHEGIDILMQHGDFDLVLMDIM